ncbi:hypothetical protein V6N13_080840 [Hibiscus sabdariffa]|uniref:Uncharacterized protein n=1 Tax=Hibiscus sabdariffa TaxID=183260 RepID=A0ABR2CBD0_9ROSI
MEMIRQAIHKLIEENRIEDTSSSDVKLSEDDEQLLSRLLSQLESLKESKRSNPPNEETSTTVDKPEPITRSGSEEESGETENIVDEDIVKELEAVRRQNTITHCLVSALIVVTLIWQLFEVSLVHELQNGLTHPFRSFGSLLTGMLPKRTAGTNDANGGDGGNDNNDHRNGEEQ